MLPGVKQGAGRDGRDGRRRLRRMARLDEPVETNGSAATPGRGAPPPSPSLPRTDPAGGWRLALATDLRATHVGGGDPSSREAGRRGRWNGPCGTLRVLMTREDAAGVVRLISALWVLAVLACAERQAQRFPNTYTPAGPPKSEAAPLPGAKAPRPKDPTCMRDAVSHVGLGTHGKVSLKVEVRIDGHVGRVKVISPEDAPNWYHLRVQHELAQCEFEPGRYADGTPFAAWVLLPVRYVGESGP